MVKWEILQILLAFPGIDLNAADKNGNTALMYAVRLGQKEVLEVLLAPPNIDVNAAGTNGKTALKIAQ